MKRDEIWCRAGFKIHDLHVWLVWPEESTKAFTIASKKLEALESLPLGFRSVFALPEHVVAELTMRIARSGSIAGNEVMVVRPFVGRKGIADVWEAIQNISRGL